MSAIHAEEVHTVSRLARDGRRFHCHVHQLRTTPRRTWRRAGVVTHLPLTRCIPAPIHGGFELRLCLAVELVRMALPGPRLRCLTRRSVWQSETLSPPTPILCVHGAKIAFVKSPQVKWANGVDIPI